MCEFILIYTIKREIYTRYYLMGMFVVCISLRVNLVYYQFSSFFFKLSNIFFPHLLKIINYNNFIAPAKIMVKILGFLRIIAQYFCFTHTNYSQFGWSILKLIFFANIFLLKQNLIVDTSPFYTRQGKMTVASLCHMSPFTQRYYMN